VHIETKGEGSVKVTPRNFGTGTLEQ